jgi:hypothetical protein
MILKKKIDASTGEAQLFTEELSEIEEQLAVSIFISNRKSIFRVLKKVHFLS